MVMSDKRGHDEEANTPLAFNSVYMELKTLNQIISLLVTLIK